MKALSIFFLTSLFSSLAFATNECERVGKVKWVKFESEKPGEVYLFKVNDDDSSRSVLKYNDEEQCEEFLGPFSQGSVNHTLVNELEVFFMSKGKQRADAPWFYLVEAQSDLESVLYGVFRILKEDEDGIE